MCERNVGIIYVNSDGSWFIAPPPHEPGIMEVLCSMEEERATERWKEVRKEVSNRIAVCPSREGGREGGRRKRKRTFLGQCIVSSFVRSPALSPLSAFSFRDDTRKIRR